MIIPCCDNDESCSEISWLTDTLPNPVVGEFYSQQLYVLGVTAPFRFYLVSGSLPPGLSLSIYGVISGYAEEVIGEYEFTVQVGDKNKCVSQKTFTMEVDFAQFRITEEGDFRILENGNYRIIE